MLYTYRKCCIFLKLGVASRQSFAGSFPSYPFKFPCLAVFSVFLSLLVGGRIALEIVDGFFVSGCFPPSWLDEQLVNEISSNAVA